MKTKTEHSFKVAMEINGEYVPLNPNPVNAVIDGIMAEKEKVVRDFLFAHGWDGKDMEQARKITEGYSFLEHPDHTFEIMQSEEAERLYGKPLELEEI